MKVPNKNIIPRNVPKWAQSQFQALLKADQSSGSSQTTDGFRKSPIPEERAVLTHWANKQGFARYQSEDNGDRDQNPADNIVEYNNVSQEFKGNFKNGHLLSQFGDEQVGLVYLDGDQSHNFFASKSGGSSYQKLDSRNPENSFILDSKHKADSRNPSSQKNEHSVATSSAAELLPFGSTASLFLAGTKDVPTLRNDLTTKLNKAISRLPDSEQAQLKKLMGQPNAHTARRLSHQLLQLSKEHPGRKDLQDLRDLSGTWQVLEDTPKMMADGIARNQVSYTSPGSLALSTAAQGWDIDKELGLPIADTVVVGGGPGGLTTGYHLSEQGQRTVIFEGGRIGQAFSDASAKSVHQLRTSANTSNLIYTNSYNQVEVSLNRNYGYVFEKGQEAKADWNEAIGETDHSNTEAGGGVNAALNRNNVFEHMAQIGHGLATKYPDTFMIENSPVSTITKIERGEQTLFRLKSEIGHEVLARSLVMATGFVGSHGEYARSLGQFGKLEESHPDKVTVLNSDHDLIAKNDQLSNQKQALVFSDRLLGRTEIRERIKALPKGSRLAVVGSGESAAKGTIEALHLNPDLKVDLYTKNALEPYQVQIPTSHINFHVTENALKDDGLAEKTLAQFKELGTPITTETMKNLLALETEGRLNVRELGERFDENSVQVGIDSRSEQSKFEIQVTNPEVSESLRQQRDTWVSSGLYGANPPTAPANKLPEAQMVMMAVGYDTSKVNTSPLTQQLVDQGLMEIKDGKVQYGSDGLTSTLSPLLGFNTAGAVKMSADTALPGRAVRGFRLAENLATKLPKREKSGEGISKDRPNNDLDPIGSLENVSPIVTLNGNDPKLVEGDRRANWAAGAHDPEDKAWGKAHDKLTRSFSGPNQTVRVLVGRYLEHPETLTPAERLTAQRAISIAKRLESSGL